MPKLPASILKWPNNLFVVVVPLPHILCEVQLKKLPDSKYELIKEDKQLLMKNKIIRKQRH